MDKIQTKKWQLYVLVKSNSKTPIYVGVTSSIEQRIRKHKLLKDFDSYYIIESFEDKKSAYSAERAIIKYLSIFKNDNIKNCLYMPFFSLKYIK